MTGIIAWHPIWLVETTHTAHQFKFLIPISIGRRVLLLIVTGRVEQLEASGLQEWWRDYNFHRFFFQ